VDLVRAFPVENSMIRDQDEAAIRLLLDVGPDTEDERVGAVRARIESHPEIAIDHLRPRSPPADCPTSRKERHAIPFVAPDK
jgi:hypothetical protein